MQKRTLGRTGLAVSAIGLGAGPYRGPAISKDRVRAVVERAVEKGINFFETAEDYDETKLGPALAPYRGGVILATKSTAHDYAGMTASIRLSAERLRTESIDIYQMHDVGSDRDLLERIERGALDALLEAKEEGTIRFIGLSGHHVSTLQGAVETGVFDMVQVPYNLGHPLAADLIRDAARRGIGVVSMKALGGGLLVDPAKGPCPPRPGMDRMTAHRAIHFVLSSPNVSSALIGFTAPDQVDEATGALDGLRPMTEQELAAANREVEALLGTDYCRTCKYCAPCAEHGWRLEIDGILRAVALFRLYGYRTAAVADYDGMALRADACSGCGTCEARCPYGLPIAARLEEAHGLLAEASLVTARALDDGREMSWIEQRLEGLERMVGGPPSGAQRLEVRVPVEEALPIGVVLEVRVHLHRVSALMSAEDRSGALLELEEGLALLNGEEGDSVIDRYRILFLELEARCHCGRGDLPSAQAVKDEAKRIGAGKADFLEETAELLFAYGLVDEGVQYLQKAMTALRDREGTDPERLRPYRDRIVRHYREQQMYREAVRFIETEMESLPDDAGLTFNLAECYMEQGKLDKAIELFRRTIALQEKINWVRFSLGKCLYLTGRYDEALDALADNLDICEDPLSHFHSWYFMAMCHHKLGHTDQVQACLEKTASFNDFHHKCEIEMEKAFLSELMDEK